MWDIINMKQLVYVKQVQAIQSSHEKSVKLKLKFNS